MNQLTATAASIVAVLDALGLDQVHLAAWGSADWGTLTTEHGHRLASLSLAFPTLRIGTPDAISLPVAAFSSDRGNAALGIARLKARAPHAEVAIFEGYDAPLWADVIADHAPAIEAGMRAHIAAHPLAPVALAATEGEVGPVHYRIEGSGPPVVVLPIGLVPSQWRPVTEALARDHCIITLGGAGLGMVATLEARARSGYGVIVNRLLDEAAPAPDAAILEVGCGPGALALALAERRRGTVPIVGADINDYLLGEARAAARARGLADAVDFRRGDAHALPFADASFDLTYCSTVLEEGQADKMLSELARVTRPGGRVVVVVRAVDVPWWINGPTDPALRTMLNELAPRTSSGAGPGGCADASLYARAAQAGLEAVQPRLQLALYAGDQRAIEVRERLVAMLSGEEGERAKQALEAAEADGTYFAAEPFHGVVARSPEASPMVDERKRYRDDNGMLAGLGFRETRSIDREGGRVVLDFIAATHHCNLTGVVQGGYITAWLDCAMSSAVFVKRGRGTTLVSLEIKTAYYGPIYPERVVQVEGWIERMGGRTVFLEGQVCGEDGSILAKASSTASVRTRSPASS